MLCVFIVPGVSAPKGCWPPGSGKRVSNADQVDPHARSKSGWRRFDWLKGDFANNSMWMTALVLVGLIDDCLG